MKNKQEIWESILTGEQINVVRITADDVRNPGRWEGVSNFKAGNWIVEPGSNGWKILKDHLFRLAYRRAESQKAA